MTPAQSEINRQIGKLIRKQRRLRDMTQSDLAEQIGTTWQTVSKWETGYIQISAPKLFEVANALGMSIQWLYPVSAPASKVVTNSDRLTT